MPSTKQINLRIEAEHEALARAVIDRIRRGGPAFREALAGFIADDDSTRYLPAAMLHQRFAEIERRLSRLEGRASSPA